MITTSEIAPDVYRISAYVPEINLQFNHFLIKDDEPLIGHLFTVAKELAAKEVIDESGYRLIMNTGADGGQTVHHIHLHLLGGAPMKHPMG